MDLIKKGNGGGGTKPKLIEPKPKLSFKLEKTVVKLFIEKEETICMKRAAVRFVKKSKNVQTGEHMLTIDPLVDLPYWQEDKRNTAYNTVAEWIAEK